jgi:hypothetical protein
MTAAGCGVCLAAAALSAAAPGLPLYGRSALESLGCAAASSLLLAFTVLETRTVARYCTPAEHELAALFICPPGVPQILGCASSRDQSTAPRGTALGAAAAPRRAPGAGPRARPAAARGSRSPAATFVVLEERVETGKRGSERGPAP